MGEVVKITKPKPKPKKELSPPVELLQAHAIRVPDELRALIRGAAIGAAFAALVLGICSLAGSKLPPPAGALIIVFAVLWLAWPYGWLYLRMQRERKKWAELLPTLARPFPGDRRNPQEMLAEPCRMLRLPQMPEVVLVPGKPAVLTVGGQIILTEQLYKQLNDTDLEILLLHEVGHQFCRHRWLLAQVRAVPSTETELVMWLTMLPGVPWFRVLDDWESWANISADRLMMVIRPNLDMAVLAVLKQVVTCSPPSEQREHLLSFLSSPELTANHGAEVMVTHEVNLIMHAHPEVETRIANLRAWAESPACANAGHILRESLAALPPA